MAVYDAGGYKLVMQSAREKRRLDEEGWIELTHGATRSTPEHDAVLYWLMAPPEQTTTLVERMRELAAEMARDGKFGFTKGGYDVLEAADALERAERIEQAARRVVDRNLLLISPPDKSDYYPIAAENVKALRDVLEEDSDG